MPPRCWRASARSAACTPASEGRGPRRGPFTGSPGLLRFEDARCAALSAPVPGRPPSCGRIVCGMPHRPSLAGPGRRGQMTPERVPPRWGRQRRSFRIRPRSVIQPAFATPRTPSFGSRPIPSKTSVATKRFRRQAHAREYHASSAPVTSPQCRKCFSNAWASLRGGGVGGRGPGTPDCSAMPLCGKYLPRKGRKSSNLRTRMRCK